MGIFGGLGTLIVNAAIIFSLMLGSKFDDAYLFVTAGLLSGLASRGWFLFAVAKRSGMPLLRSSWSLEPPSGQLVLVAVSMSAINIFPMVVRSLGSTYGEGYVSILTIAVKVIELPLTVGLASFGLLSLSVLSRLYSRGDGEVVLSLRRKTCNGRRYSG